MTTTINNKTKEIIYWAINPYINGITYSKISKDDRINAQKHEKVWGNSMISQTNNGNWTTRLGEQLVYDILKFKGENPRRPIRKNGYNPDWETDEYIYEVKTRNWTTSGTAGEKVLGTMYKYSDIPIIYKKPLKIVCVAYQEYELTHGTTKIFNNVSPTKKEFLELANKLNINYIKFSDLITNIDYTL
jgi:hypothetical protein